MHSLIINGVNNLKSFFDSVRKFSPNLITYMNYSILVGDGRKLAVYNSLLDALFALPAGLGDIAAGIAAPLVAYRLARGTGRRAARWHNAFGMTDLVVALTLGALTGFQLVNVTPSAARSSSSGSR